MVKALVFLALVAVAAADNHTNETGCMWTCTGPCTADSGTTAVGSTPDPCQSTAALATGSAWPAVCTEGAAESAFICTTNVNDFDGNDQLYWWGQRNGRPVAGGFGDLVTRRQATTGTRCNIPLPSCTELNALNDLEPVVAQRWGIVCPGIVPGPCTPSAAPYVTSAGFACPPRYNPAVALEVAQCFEDLSCWAGLEVITEWETCIDNVANYQLPCPRCPKKSKKGLLGLLGLLGLIPLLLCSSLLLCLLWLCCIRKTKTETDVHFATYDQPAAAPIALATHCEPVYSTAVHHTATVGAVHAAPVCGVPGYPGY